MSHPYPHFLIVGFMKSATTTVFEHIITHPGVQAPLMKELHYFTREFVPGYDPSLFAFEYYEQLRYDPKSAKLCGEASPSYILTADRIASFNPNAKIIILLRDPVERALSQYRQYREHGLFEYEMLDIENQPLETLHIVQDSLYEGPVSNFLDRFPAKQVMLVSFEAFCRSQHETMTAIFDFLSLPPIAIGDVRFSASASIEAPPGLKERLSEFFSGRRGGVARLIAERGPVTYPLHAGAFDRY